MSFLNIRWVVNSELIHTIKHHQNPRITCILLNSITFLSSECNSNKTNRFWQWKKWCQLLIPFYNDTVCMTTIPQCKEYGTWNQINNLHTLAKHPTQRSHSKTHWIRIENLQTKHEAWGCFKLNNTPLYDKKWVLVFFPTWNYNQYIQKKNVYMQIFYRCQILLWYNKVYKASAWKFLWSQNQRLGCNCN